MGRFKGKTAVITGSGRRNGLGEAIALKLAEEGANIVISDLGKSRDVSTASEHIGEEDEIAEVVKGVAAKGAQCKSFNADVRVRKEVIDLAQFASDRFGSLDIWVNNAGIGYIMMPLLDVKEEDWRAVIDVNLTGAFFGLQAAAAQMIKQGKGGRIINIASQAAKSGFSNAQAYTSSKHGLVGLARSAAIELGPHKVTVNNVCPNHVTTGLGAWQNEFSWKVAGASSKEEYMDNMRKRIPLGRVGLPEDTANAVAFLCSQDAQYITGESMNVSGGEEPH